MSGAEQGVEAQVVEALKQGLGDRLVAVVLFGSRARGDAREDSDWDLLLIADGLEENTYDRHMQIKRMLTPDIRGSIAVIARTTGEFESRIPSLYLDIGLDGRILYDPRGYAADRLAAIRQIIEEAGLYRLQTPAGDVWRWRQEPTQPWVIEWK